MKDELLRELDKDLERNYLTKQQYEDFKAEIISKSDQMNKLIEDRKANAIDEQTFTTWSESISNDYKEIGERWRNTVDKNLEERKKKAENRHKRPFILGVSAIVLIIAVYFGANYLYSHRSIDGVPAPVQVDLSTEEQEEVHIVEGKDIGRPNYHLEMRYLASYDIKGLVVDTKHMGEETPFDKSFPIDVSLAWGEYAANRSVMECSNGPRKLSCKYSIEDLNSRTRAGRGITNMVSNNHLSPADNEIYQKMKRIRPGNYVELKGYLVYMKVTDESGVVLEAASSLSRTDHMDSIFDTTNTGCEIFYVTSVEWLD